MEYLPYSCQNIDQSDIDAVDTVLRSQFLTQGSAVPAFEKKFADLHGAEHAIAVSSATAALHIGALALGLRRGSRLWTSPISFVASANCALYCEAEVDFVDIDPRTRNMSVDALRQKLRRAAQKNALPDVVVPVDFAGMSADMLEMRQLASEFGFRLMEDASHATGGLYQGRAVGALADVAVFSFHAVKIVTTGEGGLLTTSDPKIAESLRKLRTHGITRDANEFAGSNEGAWYYEQQTLGYNYRMTDIQAALGASQLDRLKAWSVRRQYLADRYYELLSGLPLLLPLQLPDRMSAWHLFAIEVDSSVTQVTRASVFDALRRAKIGANVHYIPIHLQPFYRKLGFKRGDFPMAEAYYDRAISIPLYPAMKEEDQDRVASVLRAALTSG